VFKEGSFLAEYFDEYLRYNRDARQIIDEIKKSQFDASKLIDHCTIRTLDIEKVAGLLYAEGFEKRPDGMVDMGDWFLQSFYKQGYPIIVVDQQKPWQVYGNGGGKIIHDWVNKFGDAQFHHIAICVGKIDIAVETWQRWGIVFTGKIVSDSNTGLKQIFTKPVLKDELPYTVLEFMERPPGCSGLIVKNADALVLSSRP
jgi:hypothetical protein